MKPFDYPTFVLNVRQRHKIYNISENRKIYLSELITSDEKRLDLRVWKDGAPTGAGLFLSLPMARLLCKLINEYLESEPKPAPAPEQDPAPGPRYSLSELGFNPWQNTRD